MSVIVPLSDEFYFQSDVVKLLGVSRVAIYKARKAGRFPEPNGKLGRHIVWRKSTVDQWRETFVNGAS